MDYPLEALLEALEEGLEITGFCTPLLEDPDDEDLPLDPRDVLDPWTGEPWKWLHPLT